MKQLHSIMFMYDTTYLYDPVCFVVQDSLRIRGFYSEPGSYLIFLWGIYKSQIWGGPEIIRHTIVPAFNPLSVSYPFFWLS